jgi:aminopeptidase N
MHSRFPSEERMQQLIYETVASVHRDQPITTSADSMYKLNYQAITYYKTADWFKKLEQEISRPLFDSSIQTYFQRWQFKHPEAEDLQQVFTDVSGKNLDEIFWTAWTNRSLIYSCKKETKICPVYFL